MTFQRIESEKRCPDCRRDTLVRTTIFRVNYPFGRNGHPALRKKKRFDVCENVRTTRDGKVTWSCGYRSVETFV